MKILLNYLTLIRLYKILNIYLEIIIHLRYIFVNAFIYLEFMQ